MCVRARPLASSAVHAPNRDETANLLGTVRTHMFELKIALALMGLSAFVLPAFFLFNRDSNGVKDPAVEEMEQRRQANREK